MKIEIKKTNGSIIALGVEEESLITLISRLVDNGANLHEADLHGADLCEADLHGANLYGADLHGANLCGADLHGANLRGADLRGADLYGADLRRADLYGADLRRANLYGADLYGADLDYACLPLWCGGQFKADTRICKQLMAHVIRIMNLSDEPVPEGCIEYIKGWHRESEF